MRPRAPAPTRAGSVCKIAVDVDDEPDRRGERRVVDVIRQPADAFGRGPANRQIEDLFGDLGHAFEHRAAAGQHDAGVERLLVAGASDLVPEQVADFLGARLQDLRQHAPRHRPRSAAGDAGDFHRFVFGHERGQGASGSALELLGVRDRHPQADGDVVGEVIATDRQHARVPEAAPLEDREVRRAAADIDERDARVPFRPGVSTASLAASCSRTVSTTSTPARLTQAIMFCIDDELPVTTCTFTSSRLPVIPTGTAIPS